MVSLDPTMADIKPPSFADFQEKANAEFEKKKAKPPTPDYLSESDQEGGAGKGGGAGALQNLVKDTN